MDMRQVAMAQDAGTGVLGLQFLEQIPQGTLLSVCAGIRGLSFLIESALVAYAQGIPVITHCMCSYELFVTGLGDGAVACDVVVIAGEPEAVCVVADELRHAVVLVAACGTAVHNDQIDATHDVTPNAVAIADRILIAV